MMTNTTTKVKKNVKPQRGLVSDLLFKELCAGLKAQHPDMKGVEIGQTIYDGLCEANGRPVKKREVELASVETDAEAEVVS